MKFFKLNPTNQARLKRFKASKRGYYSFWLLMAITLFAFTAELFINNKALVVKYNDSYYFPVVGEIPGVSLIYKGSEFGENYEAEALYRDINKKWKATDSENWMIMPFIPYGAEESENPDLGPISKKRVEIRATLAAAIKQAKSELTGTELDTKISVLKTKALDAEIEACDGLFHPLPPDFSRRHYLGTDVGGKDILARIVYGYRIAIIFALVLLACTYTVGVTVGCIMGYYGGVVDLIVQRLIEILQRVPFLYVIMILVSVYGQSFKLLLTVMIIFGWTGATRQIRTATYREKARDYIMAARSLGATDSRIIFVHIIPSTISLLVTFIPFSISASIIGLTSLDFLGLGLPAGTPSWGELIKMGTENMSSPWIVSSVVGSMILLLFLISLIGESVRSAFDPKKYTKYE